MVFLSFSSRYRLDFRGLGTMKGCVRSYFRSMASRGCWRDTLEDVVGLRPAAHTRHGRGRAVSPRSLVGKGGDVEETEVKGGNWQLMVRNEGSSQCGLACEKGNMEWRM